MLAPLSSGQAHVFYFGLDDVKVVIVAFCLQFDGYHQSSCQPKSGWLFSNQIMMSDVLAVRAGCISLLLLIIHFYGFRKMIDTSV